MFVNIVFTLVFVGGCIAMGLLLAILVDQRIRGESVFRSIFLVPDGALVRGHGHGVGLDPATPTRAST